MGGVGGRIDQAIPALPGAAGPAPPGPAANALAHNRRTDSRPPCMTRPEPPSPAAHAARRRSASAPRRLTLMQLITAMTLLAAVAVFAIPMHQRYLKHRASQAAAMDLSSLHRHLQAYLASLPVVDDATLPVPAPAVSVATPEGTVTSTVSLMQQFYAKGWQPHPGGAFEFGAAFDAGGYTLTANGRTGQACRLSIVATNATREAPTQILRAAKGADCGFQTW